MLKKGLVLVQRLKQIDNFSFQIVWSDGRVDIFRLSWLQQHCPCSHCRLGTRVFVDEEVRAKKIVSVGVYALSVEFSSGCSKGIFTFSFLRELALEVV